MGSQYSEAIGYKVSTSLNVASIWHTDALTQMEPSDQHPTC